LQERPDAILPTMGGQTGLNLAKNLAEVSEGRMGSTCQ
jgi:carbamoylphosphate synthase large subunit